MKLSKKVLAAMSASALLLTAGIFTSCGDEEDDDENEMISGSNNDYTLSYDNSASTDTSRGYDVTKNNHKGALVQITLNKDGTTGYGAAMGYIWDLSSTDASASAEDLARAVSDKPRNFCIAGFGYQTSKGIYTPYVSRYTNVYDVQAANFGTKKSDGTGGVTVNGKTQYAEEKVYIDMGEYKVTADNDGKYVVTINVYEETTADSTDSTKTVTTGGYVVDIYNGAVAKADLKTATKLASTTISAADLGYDTAKAVTQKQGAVYANVYAGSKASGTWHYADTYSAAEAVEE